MPQRGRQGQSCFRTHRAGLRVRAPFSLRGSSGHGVFLKPARPAPLAGSATHGPAAGWSEQAAAPGPGDPSSSSLLFPQPFSTPPLLLERVARSLHEDRHREWALSVVPSQNSAQPSAHPHGPPPKQEGTSSRVLLKLNSLLLSTYSRPEQNEFREGINFAG